MLFDHLTKSLEQAFRELAKEEDTSMRIMSRLQRRRSLEEGHEGKANVNELIKKCWRWLAVCRWRK